ncbi:cytochrome P450 [Apiospora saccharicola]|uniref:Cytochrome P450 n=1 Tax=Apiospora saccharicola TaxID=335842 RepID=A0ABR1W1N1_9PEZI
MAQRILDAILPGSGLGSVVGLASCLVIAGVAAAAWRIAYSLYFHPLKGFPGPWYTACTSLPLGIAGLSPYEPAWISRLVEKYSKNGSPVRITPDLLLFPKARQLRDIYWDAACNTKGGIYHHNAIGPTSLFTTIGADDHRKLRKSLGGSFWSVGTLRKSWEGKIDELVVNWVANRKKPSESGQPMVLSNKTSEFAADVMTTVLFTKSWGFVQNDRDERGMLQAWRDGVGLFGLATRWRFMREVILSSKLKDYLLPKLSDDKGNGWLMGQGAREISNRHSSLQKSMENGGNAPPQFKDALQTAFDARVDEEPLNDIQKLAHTTLLIQAGADTTGTGLGLTLRLILKHPEVLAKVRKEIAAAEAKGALSNPVVQYEETKRHLPYISACIRESLRLEPPIPQLLSRLAPAEGKSIDGIPIPAGAEMLSYANVVHRDPDAFGPEPVGEFRPERWLQNEERSARMDANMFTFGMGPRVCLGKELALMEMHKLVPEVFRRFDIEVLEEGRYSACGGIAYLRPGLIARLNPRE